MSSVLRSSTGKDASELADERTSGPETSGRVEEGRDLGGGSSVCRTSRPREEGRIVRGRSAFDAQQTKHEWREKDRERSRGREGNGKEVRKQRRTSSSEPKEESVELLEVVGLDDGVLSLGGGVLHTAGVRKQER